MDDGRRYITTATLDDLLRTGRATNPRWATCCHACGEGGVDFLNEPAAWKWRDEHVRWHGDSHLVSIGVEFELPNGRSSGWFFT